MLEKNETLYKLGKMAMEKNSKLVPEVEIFEDENQDGLDTLVKSSIETRKSGFKRSNPAAAAEAQKNKAPDLNPIMLSLEHRNMVIRNIQRLMSILKRLLLKMLTNF